MDGDTPRTLSVWAALLVRSREGDEVAFEELIRGCERRVLGIAYQITGNLEDARDVAQESFIRLYRARDRFQEDRSFEAWLYRIVVNQARRSLVRRLRRRTESIEESGAESFKDPAGQEPGAGLDAAGLPARVIPLLDELPPRLRAVFVLRDLQGMETAEISRILGCTETTVRRHSAESRSRIRSLLERRHPGLLRAREKKT